ncbi:hypothetical protein [Scytonema sp. HK-05]|nr:hypothetical protein [Scytonema sp. HK-05]
MRSNTALHRTAGSTFGDARERSAGAGQSLPTQLHQKSDRTSTKSERIT